VNSTPGQRSENAGYNYGEITVYFVHNCTGQAKCYKRLKIIKEDRMCVMAHVFCTFWEQNIWRNVRGTKKLIT